jgi:hypothetical protein
MKLSRSKVRAAGRSAAFDSLTNRGAGRIFLLVVGRPANQKIWAANYFSQDFRQVIFWNIAV